MELEERAKKAMLIKDKEQLKYCYHQLPQYYQDNPQFPMTIKKDIMSVFLVTCQSRWIKDRRKRTRYSGKIESDIRCSVLAPDSENCGADNTNCSELGGGENSGRTY